MTGRRIAVAGAVVTLLAPVAAADQKVNVGILCDQPLIAELPDGWAVLHYDDIYTYGYSYFDRTGNRTVGPKEAGVDPGCGPMNRRLASTGTTLGWLYDCADQGPNDHELWFHLLDDKGDMIGTPIEVAPTAFWPGLQDLVFEQGEFVASYMPDAIIPLSVEVARISVNGTPTLLEASVFQGAGGRTIRPEVGRSSAFVGVMFDRVDAAQAVYHFVSWIDGQGQLVVPPTEYMSNPPGIGYGTGDVVSRDDRLVALLSKRDLSSGNQLPAELVHVDQSGQVVLGPMVVEEPGTGKCCTVTTGPQGIALCSLRVVNGASQSMLQRMSDDGFLRSDAIQVSDVPPGPGADGGEAAYNRRAYGAVWYDYRNQTAWADIYFDIAPAYEVFVLGAGPSPGASPVVTLVQPKRTGGPAVVTIAPYASGGYGANVGSGDVDTDEADEVLTGPGPGPTFGPQVRAFTWRGVPKAKVNFYAYGTLRYGVKVNGADLDGDRVHEMLTTPGPGAVFGPHVRGFDFDNQQVTPVAKVSFFAYATLKYGANAAAGDVDRDDFADMLTGPGPGAMFGSHLRGFSYDNAAVQAIAKVNAMVYPAATHGLHVTGGDADLDGYDEIACGPGPGPSNPDTVAVYDVDGGALVEKPGSRFSPFPGFTSGVQVSFCQEHDGDVHRELMTSRGPVPAATCEVRTWDDAVAGFGAIRAFDPYPAGTHGSTLSSVFVGF